MLEFRDLRSGIWVKILVVVFHRPKVHILHRQIVPFRVAGWQHLGVWPLVDQEFGLGGFGIRPNSEVGIWRIRDLTKKVRFLVLRCPEGAPIPTRCASAVQELSAEPGARARAHACAVCGAI